jgi:hypothetical protein
MRFTMKSPSYLFLAAILAIALPVGSGNLRAQALTKDSPFIAPGSNGGGPAAAGNMQMYALVGVIGGDRSTRIGILDLRTRKSVWIPIGQTIAGIEAISHNPSTDEVLVRINGSVQSLSLRMPNMSAALLQGLPAAGSLGPGPFPPGASASAPFGTMPMGPGPFPPGTPGGGPLQPSPVQASGRPSNQADQEREARMMVSDLLDIGMQQRKAYQEAQKKSFHQPTQPTASNPSTVPAAPPIKK